MKKSFKTLKNVYASLYENNKLEGLKSFVNKNKIKKINKGVEYWGTGLRGYVKTTFDNIVSKLGQPEYADHHDDKVLARWAIQFEDDMVITIYIYKLTQIPKEEYHWHVGSNDKLEAEEAVDRASFILGAPASTDRYQI